MAFQRTESTRGPLPPAVPTAPSLALSALTVFAALSLAPLDALAQASAKRCDWHGPRSKGETPYTQCVDYAGLSGKTVDLPGNVTRISHDGVSFCAGSFNATPGAADIVYMMDNSGSMEDGENSGGFSTDPGDPHGIRDRVIRRAMRMQRASADTGSAGFLSYFGLGSNQDWRTVSEIETNKLQRPLDISRFNPQGEANLRTVMSKVWKHRPDEALLPKVSAGPLAKEAKKALTYWSESLIRANSWFRPESGFVKTRNHAIIMISDGAIGDWAEVLKLVPSLPPVYGIHLGKDQQAQNMRDLASLTKGKFYLVSPTDTSALDSVMQSIIGIVTKNPRPRGVTVTNTANGQVSRSLEFNPNPDGSLAIALDSIIGLKVGANPIQLRVTKDDNSIAPFDFTLNVAQGGSPLNTTGGNFTCHDMPKLMVTDAGGDTLEVYSQDATRQNIQLNRAPSELTTVTVAATTESGDKESLPVKAGIKPYSYVQHKDEFRFNGKDGSPSAGNGTVEVGNFGAVTLSWSHPRDPRETDTYILLGKKVPVIIAGIDVTGPKDVVRGPTDNSIVGSRIKDPIVIVDRNDKCLQNCSGTDPIIRQKANIPVWKAIVRSPIRMTLSIYDNLGQFVNESKHEITQETWDAMPKDGDSARVEILYLPIAHDGRTIATGAYLMRMEIQGIGGGLVRNSAGEMVELKASRQEYFKRFGFVRQ